MLLTSRAYCRARRKKRLGRIFIPLILLFWFGLMAVLIYFFVAKASGNADPLGKIELGGESSRNIDAAQSESLESVIAAVSSTEAMSALVTASTTVDSVSSTSPASSVVSPVVSPSTAPATLVSPTVKPVSAAPAVSTNDAIMTSTTSIVASAVETATAPVWGLPA